MNWRLRLLMRRQVALRNGSRLPPRPIRQLGFQSTYTIEFQSIPRHPCSLLPMYLSQIPPGGRRFVANKSISAIRPSGHRTVEALFSLLSSPFSVVCHVLCGLRFSKIFCIACTLKCCEIVADLLKRIKSELRTRPFYSTLYSRTRETRGFSSGRVRHTHPPHHRTSIPGVRIETRTTHLMRLGNSLFIS